MSREIIKTDCYRNKLYKLIPGEAVALFLLCKAFFEKVRIVVDRIDYTIAVEWTFFVSILIFIPVYLLQYQRVFRGFQLIISSVGFIFWGMALTKEISLVGSILLITWILLSPLFLKTNPAH